MAKIAFLTAGGAGMYCGSCMRDNTLVAHLLKLECEVVLIPTYTPIRTDEADVSLDQVFFGGINVFLQEKWSLFRYLPKFLDRWLDRPGLIRKVSSGNIAIDAAQLGEMTVSMLRGEQGRQRKEVSRLVDFLAQQVQPKLVDLSNILIGGCIPAMKKRLKCPVIVTLQGDDLFLNGLTEPYKSQAFAEIRSIVKHVDGFIAYSNFYADQMADLFAVPREKFHIVPLGINIDDFSWGAGLKPATNSSANPKPPTVGYLARICPAKGFDVLVDAFLELRKMPGMEKAKLLTAGWLGESDRPYFDAECEKLRANGAEANFEYRGVLDREQKLSFLQELDVFSVPTTYQEPKGLYVLEALASGVPVVQPAHGAFPEYLANVKSARLFDPREPAQLAVALHGILEMEPAFRQQWARMDQSGFENHFSGQKMAKSTLAVYDRYLHP